MMTLSDYVYLLGTIAVFAVAAYLTVGILINMQEHNSCIVLQRRDKLYVLIIFGIITFYAAAATLPYNGINIRLAGPTIAGLLAGPLVGMGTAVFAVVYLILEKIFLLPTAAIDGGSFFWVATFSMLSAGLIGGGIRILNKYRWPSVKLIIITVLLTVIVQSGLILALLTPLAHAWDIACWVFITFVPYNLLAVGFCLLMLKIIWNKSLNDKKIGDFQSQVALAQRVQQSLSADSLEKCSFWTYQAEHVVKTDVSQLVFSVREIDKNEATLVMAGVRGTVIETLLYLPLVQAACRLAARTGKSFQWLLEIFQKFAQLFNEYKLRLNIIVGVIDVVKSKINLLCIGGARIYYKHGDEVDVIVGRELANENSSDAYLYNFLYGIGTTMFCVNIDDNRFPEGYDDCIKECLLAKVPQQNKWYKLKELHKQLIKEKCEYAIFFKEN